MKDCGNRNGMWPPGDARPGKKGVGGMLGRGARNSMPMPGGMLLVEALALAPPESGACPCNSIQQRTQKHNKLEIAQILSMMHKEEKN